MPASFNATQFFTSGSSFQPTLTGTVDLGSGGAVVALAVVASGASLVSPTTLVLDPGGAAVSMTSVADISLFEQDSSTQGRARLFYLAATGLTGNKSFTLSNVGSGGAGNGDGLPRVMFVTGSGISSFANIAFQGIVSGASISRTVSSAAGAQAAFFGLLIDGGTLAATSPTVLRGEHSIVGDLSAVALTENGAASVTLEAAVTGGFTPYQFGWVLSALEAATPSGLNGDAVLDSLAAGGGLSTAGGGVITSDPFTGWGGFVHANVAVPHVMLIRASDRVVVYSAANVTTNAQGRLVISDPAIVAGVAYMLPRWNADGSLRGIKRYVAT